MCIGAFLWLMVGHWSLPLREFMQHSNRYQRMQIPPARQARRAALDALRQRVRSRSGLGHEPADGDWQHRHRWQSGGALPSRLPTCRRGRVFRAISLDRLAGGPCQLQFGRRTYRIPGIAGGLRGSRIVGSEAHCSPTGQCWSDHDDSRMRPRSKKGMYFIIVYFINIVKCLCHLNR